MQVVQVPFNYGGKLFADQFNLLFIQQPDFAPGNIVQVNVNSVNWGTAKIEAVRSFLFRSLSDMVSFLNMGADVQQQAFQLNRFYGSGQTLPPDTMLMHLVCSWQQRNLEDQTEFINDWWQAKKTIYAD
jgi:hypothetical protein